MTIIDKTAGRTITRRESIRRSKLDDIYAETPNWCECCKTVKDGVFQDDDYAYVCNRCYWIRTDRVTHDEPVNPSWNGCDTTKLLTS